MTLSTVAPRIAPPTLRTVRLRSRVQGPSSLEWVFAAFALITYQGAFLPVLRTLRQGNKTAAFEQAVEGDPTARYALLSIIIITLILCVAQWRRMLPILKMLWPFWLFVGFCTASAVWSDNPELAFRRSVSLFGSFLFGAYAFVRFGPHRFIPLFAGVGGVAAFCSVVLLILAPSLAYDPSYYVTSAVRGVYAQKNEMSAYATYGLCAAVSALFFDGKYSNLARSFLWFSALFMFVTLMLSRGMSSIVSFGLVVALLLGLHRRLGWQVRLFVTYSFIIMLLVLAFIIYMDTTGALGLVGKDATLTGRLPVWIESIKAILARPFLGYGYITFWDPESARTQYVWNLIGWPAPNAHDGYFDLILGVGVFAAGYYVFLCGRAAIIAMRNTRAEVIGMRWFVVFVSVMFLLNLDEGTLAWPDAISIQMIFGYCLVETFRAEKRAA